MGADIILSEHDQWSLTIALDLESAGFPAAARHLRSKIVPLKTVNWDDLPASTRTDPTKWAELFRKHRGSLSPISPAVHHGPPAAPILVPPPSPRADQPIA